MMIEKKNVCIYISLKFQLFFLGQGFADKRKKKVQYEYLKMLRKEKKKRERTALPHTSFEDTDMTEEKIGKEK